MRINLEEPEIQAAVIEYIGNQGIDLSHKDVTVALIAGRGDNGHKASIEIAPMLTEPVVPAMPAEDVLETEQALPFE